MVLDVKIKVNIVFKIFSWSLKVYKWLRFLYLKNVYVILFLMEIEVVVKVGNIFLR